MVEAIIFDMDGVLFDTEKYYYDRRASFLAQKGISIDHLPPSFFIGGNTKQVWEIFSEMTMITGMCQFYKKSIMLINKTTPYPIKN